MGIFLTILGSFFTWLTGGIAMRALTASAIVAAVAAMVALLLTFIPDWLSGTAISSAFANLPSGIWYFLDLFQFAYGVPLLAGAWVARFLIRRIPFIG